MKTLISPDNTDRTVAPAQFSLRTLFGIVTVSAVGLALWPWYLNPFGQLFLGTWGSAIVGVVATAVFHWRSLRADPTTWTWWQVWRHRLSLALTVESLIAPTLLFGFFVRVFCFGGSHVAQFAGQGGLDLWSLWFHVWGTLALPCAVSVPVCVVGLLIFFRPRRNTAYFIMQGCALANALIATWVVATFIPDA